MIYGVGNEFTDFSANLDQQRLIGGTVVAVDFADVFAVGDLAGEGFRVVDAQAEGEGLFIYPPALWYEKALIAGERVGFCRQRSNMRRLSRVRPIRMMSCGRVR